MTVRELLAAHGLEPDALLDMELGRATAAGELAVASITDDLLRPTLELAAKMRAVPPPPKRPVRQRAEPGDGLEDCDHDATPTHSGNCPICGEHVGGGMA